MWDLGIGLDVFATGTFLMLQRDVWRVWLERGFMMGVEGNGWFGELCQRRGTKGWIGCVGIIRFVLERAMSCAVWDFFVPM